MSGNAADWHEVPDPGGSGRMYFANPVTGESSWTRPACMGPPPTASMVAPAAAPVASPAVTSAPSFAPVDTAQPASSSISSGGGMQMSAPGTGSDGLHRNFASMSLKRRGSNLMSYAGGVANVSGASSLTGMGGADGGAGMASNGMAGGSTGTPMAAAPAQSAEPETKEEKREKTRKMLINEICSTEGSYCDSLSVMLNVYRKPLIDGADETMKHIPRVIKRHHIDVLFSNAQALLDLGIRFKAEMDRVNKATQAGEEIAGGMGKLFVEFAPYLRIYQTYVNNHEKASLLLSSFLNPDAAKYKPKFVEFHEQALQNVSCKGQSLASFFIMPIQRVPRYKLLLIEVDKYTPDSSPDKAALADAIEAVSEVADGINEACKDAEKNEQLLRIQELFDHKVPEILQPHRFFVRLADMNKVTPKGQMQEHLFLLFNDLLLVALVGKKVKLVHKIIINKDFSMTECVNERMPGNADARLCFRIEAKKLKLIVSAPNDDLYQDWVDDITDAIEQFHRTINGGPSGPGHFRSQEGQQDSQMMQSMMQQQSTLMQGQFASPTSGGGGMMQQQQMAGSPPGGPRGSVMQQPGQGMQQTQQQQQPMMGGPRGSVMQQPQMGGGGMMQQQQLARPPPGGPRGSVMQQPGQSMQRPGPPMMGGPRGSVMQQPRGSVMQQPRGSVMQQPRGSVMQQQQQQFPGQQQQIGQQQQQWQ